MYEGKSDHSEHAATFMSQMMLFRTTDSLMCRTFPMTLRGVAREWFDNLSLELISSLGQLVKGFELNFISYRLPKKPTNSLLTIRQEEKESLESCTRRFNNEVYLVVDPTPSVLISAYISGLQPSWFFYKVITQPPATLSKLLQEATTV